MKTSISIVTMLASIVVASPFPKNTTNTTLEVYVSPALRPGYVDHHTSIPFPTNNTSPFINLDVFTDSGRDGSPATYTCGENYFLASTSMNFLRNCDRAVNERMNRSPDFYYDPSWESGMVRPGNPSDCENDLWRGCGLGVEGPMECKRSGDMMWWDYKNIRETGGCPLTGVKYWDLNDSPEHRGKLECVTKIEYIWACNRGYQYDGRYLVQTADFE